MTIPAAPRFVLEFTKMSGAGNDFIVIDNRFYRFTDDELSGFASRFCPRRSGVGADGLLALNVATNPDGYSYRMKYFNADGSLGTMCGNGARCLARFAVAAGVRRDEAGTDLVRVAFESDADLRSEDSPAGYSADVPLDQARNVRLYVPPPAGTRLERRVEYVASPLHTLHTGTQHAVLFVEDAEACDVHELGPRIRKDAAVAAGGTNVNFVQIVDGRGLRVRTWEKGVEAETLACGTGALASALAAASLGHVDGPPVDIRATGGTLRVGWSGSSDHPKELYLEGPADVIYRGSVEL